MKFRITLMISDTVASIAEVEAAGYAYDSDALTLTGADGRYVASFAAGRWITIERLPD